MYFSALLHCVYSSVNPLHLDYSVGELVDQSGTRTRALPTSGLRPDLARRTRVAVSDASAPFTHLYVLLCIPQARSNPHDGVIICFDGEGLCYRRGRHDRRALHREDEGGRGQDQDAQPASPHGVLWRAR